MISLQAITIVDDHLSFRYSSWPTQPNVVGFARDFSKGNAMLENDFANSKLASSAEYTESLLPYRFLIRAPRLTASVQ